MLGFFEGSAVLLHPLLPDSHFPLQVGELGHLFPEDQLFSLRPLHLASQGVQPCLGNVRGLFEGL